MYLSFLGAAREVTGSCHYLEACGKKMLVDCGLIQGHADKEDQENLGVGASEIDYVFLTHAHIDHTGRMPLLSKTGFSRKGLRNERNARSVRDYASRQARISRSLKPNGKTARGNARAQT